MKQFILKTLVVFAAVLIGGFIINSIGVVEDKTYTITTYQIVYDLDTPQETLGGLTMREVYEDNVPLPEGIKQYYIDFWQGIYNNLVGA